MHHSERVQNLDESNVAGEHSVAEGQRAAVDEGPPREGILLRAAVTDPVGRRALHDVALRARKGKGIQRGMPAKRSLSNSFLVHVETLSWSS